MIEYEAQAITTLDKIKQRGGWQTIIRPHQFQPTRIDSLEKLSFIVEKATINELQRFPIVAADNRWQKGDDWIGQEFEWRDILEAWRFYQSGQFFHVGGFREDWRDYTGSEVGPNWNWGQVLTLDYVVTRFSQIFRFAAHLALAREYNSEAIMHIEWKLTQLTDRALITLINQPKDTADKQYPSKIDEYTGKVDLSTIELVGSSQELALREVEKFIQHFGYSSDYRAMRERQAHPYSF